MKRNLLFYFFFSLTALFLSGNCFAIASADLQKTKETVINDGYTASQILKVWHGGSDPTAKNAFKEYSAADLKGKKVYLVSHGIKDRYDTTWIKDTAAAIMETDPQAVVISIDWDKYSGFKNNTLPNVTASSWINAVSSIVADELTAQSVTVECSIGHSYGAHMLASVTSYMDKRKPQVSNVKKLLALDHAEESLTLTGDKDSRGIMEPWMTDSKKSSNWGLSNTQVETYKSSVFLGSEIMQGDYNYLLAETGAISPRDAFGDWKTVNNNGITGNHGVAANWVADQIRATGVIGSWFNNEVNVHGAGSISGIVNADNVKIAQSTKDQISSDTERQLLYSCYAMKGSTPVWGDAFFEMAMNTQDWQGEGLKDKNGNLITSVEIIDHKADEELNRVEKKRTVTVGTVFAPDKQAAFQKKYGASPDIEVSVFKDKTEYKNTKTGDIIVEDAKGNRILTSASGETTVIKSAPEYKSVVTQFQEGASWDDILKDAGVEILKDAAKNAGFTKDSYTTAIKDAWKNSQGGFFDKIGNVVDALKTTTKDATSKIWDNLLESGKGWFKQQYDNIKSYFTLDKLEDLAEKGIQKLLDKNPKLAKFLNEFLGLKNAGDIISLGKELYNGLKSLLGGNTLLDVLKECTLLKNVLNNLLQAGVNYLINTFIKPMLSKAISAIAGWLQKFVNKILGKFGITANIDFNSLLNNALVSGLQSGFKWVKTSGVGWLEKHTSSKLPQGSNPTFKNKMSDVLVEVFGTKDKK